MSAHKIVFGAGAQELSFVPTIRVDAATFIIEDFAQQSTGSSERVLSSGNATLDPLDTTVDVTSGPGQADPTKVFVASTTHVTASHRYVISHVDDAAQETFTVVGVNLDNYILIDSPLLRSYPTGSAVQGIRFTATFPASNANDDNLMRLENPMRIIWTSSLSGTLSRAQDQITILRTTTGDLNIDDVMARISAAWPDYSTRFSGGFKLKAAVNEARIEIESRLKGKSTRPEEFLMGQQGQSMLYWRTMMHLAMFGDAPGNVNTDDFFDKCKMQFEDVWGDLNTGEPGEEVAEIDRSNDIARANENVQYRSIIRPL